METLQSILETPENRSVFLQDIIKLCPGGTFNAESLRVFNDKYSKKAKSPEKATDDSKKAKSAEKAAHDVKIMYDEVKQTAPAAPAAAAAAKEQIPSARDVIKLFSNQKYLNDSRTIIDILNKIKEEETRSSISPDGIFRPTQNLKDLLQIGKTIGIEQLTTVSLPNTVKKVDCRECYLTRLSAPNATIVICPDCPSLIELNAPRVTLSVDCRGCPSLIKLDAPKVTGVNCSGCTSLIKLNVEKAITVVCSGCPSLTKFSAPKALRVDCSGCTSLPRAIIENLKTRKVLIGFGSEVSR